MYKTLSVFLIASTAITPIALNAEQSFFKDKLPSIVKNIAQGFADVDSDGDIDIMLINNGDPKLPAGSYLRNNGSMQFTFIKAAKGSNIQRLPQSAFKK